ncbi:MAG TPA: polyribonucleotide nucleotidyltransferase [Candidatus Megaira endosymbiont of Hartmannula sinica]|nr:polyribonucleotide nucleotidyltransferase [Candidatus Megaera endosymbiont of Hartmannula sinica]
MFNEIKKTIEIAGDNIELSTGKIANQSDGAVVLKIGNTMILSTVNYEKEPRKNLDFFPLSVNYQEKYHANGKIPGGFIKRDNASKASDREVLISRLIDRPIRPCFAKNFANETQIISTLHSYDKNYSSDVLAIIASSAALSISGAPYESIIAAVRVAYINDEYVINPKQGQMANSRLDIIVAGNKGAVVMVESKSDVLTEEHILKAIEMAHVEIKKIITSIEEFKKEVIANKQESSEELNETINEVDGLLNSLGINNNNDLLISDTVNSLSSKISSIFEKQIISIFSSPSKKQRSTYNKKIFSLIFEVMSSYYNSLTANNEKDTSLNINEKFINKDDKELNDILSSISSSIALKDNFVQILRGAYEKAKQQLLRSQIIHKSLRIGGRSLDNIRDIECEIDVIDSAHGSSLFSRGETQALVSATLGSSHDMQVIDEVCKQEKEGFMLNYVFPPSSVGECGMLKGPSRREIGHGNLALKAVKELLQKNLEDFPYTIRVVSEITACNGSSSMASICGASMALMNAGVPLKQHVAGIAMGLVKDGDKHAILSDIMGEEDALGDMDFKVAGTKDGVTALQMDIKIEDANDPNSGISFDILKEAMEQAKKGRISIINKMEQAITSPGEIKEHAPIIGKISVKAEKIKDVIGSGGKVIKDLCAMGGAKIDVLDSGEVTITAPDKKAFTEVKEKIEQITYEPKVGEIIDGVVAKIISAGAFISYNSAGKDGFLHISEVSDKRIDSVEDALKEGQKVKVRITGFDRGKITFSMKSSSGRDNSSNSYNSGNGNNRSGNRDRDRDDNRRGARKSHNSSFGSRNSYNDDSRNKRSSSSRFEKRSPSADRSKTKRKYFD